MARAIPGAGGRLRGRRRLPRAFQSFTAHMSGNSVAMTVLPANSTGGRLSFAFSLFLCLSPASWPGPCSAKRCFAAAYTPMFAPASAWKHPFCSCSCFRRASCITGQYTRKAGRHSFWLPRCCLWLWEFKTRLCIASAAWPCERLLSPAFYQCRPGIRRLCLLASATTLRRGRLGVSLLCRLVSSRSATWSFICHLDRLCNRRRRRGTLPNCGGACCMAAPAIV